MEARIEQPVKDEQLKPNYFYKALNRLSHDRYSFLIFDTSERLISFGGSQQKEQLLLPHNRTETSDFTHAFLILHGKKINTDEEVQVVITWPLNMSGASAHNQTFGWLRNKQGNNILEQIQKDASILITYENDKKTGKETYYASGECKSALMVNQIIEESVNGKLPEGAFCFNTKGSKMEDFKKEDGLAFVCFIPEHLIRLDTTNYDQHLKLQRRYSASELEKVRETPLIRKTYSIDQVGLFSIKRAKEPVEDNKEKKLSDVTPYN
ncbi:Uncharacterised protein [Legionella beliardensis]|uniref:Uncharacterized protein n=1 Tax=Legionella beliardensis TaxID=91822 RepID=A0A378JXY0_9GAMM|nr:hypothetical protein [Legionella beliardensis]STX55611.1 Uncharacterised protein [Legionella beliardensis]